MTAGYFFEYFDYQLRNANMSPEYRPMMFQRLNPRMPWSGGRITDIDQLTLNEAAREATKHVGVEVTTADFLRAAARGEIALRAIVHSSAKVQKHDGGIYCNQGAPTENTVPKGAIPTLPIVACQQLANAGRARWRTFEGFERIDGQLCRFDIAWLAEGEPDFETTSDDCRVSGFDVRALAEAEAARIEAALRGEAHQERAPAPAVATVRQRHDDLALELERILAHRREQGERIAPHAVMDVLRERAGNPDSCIAASVPAGVTWTPASGKVKELNMKALSKRIKGLLLADRPDRVTASTPRRR